MIKLPFSLKRIRTVSGRRRSGLFQSGRELKKSYKNYFLVAIEHKYYISVLKMLFQFKNNFFIL